MRTVQIRKVFFLWGNVASHSQVYPKSWILGIFSSGDVPVPTLRKYDETINAVNTNQIICIQWI